MMAVDRIDGVDGIWKNVTMETAQVTRGTISVSKGRGKRSNRCRR